MKTLLLTSVVVMGCIIACQQNGVEVLSPPTDTSQNANTRFKKTGEFPIKLVFRHTPLFGQECEGYSICPSCTCPLGICICRGIAYHTGSLSLAELREGFGTATMYVDDDDKLRIVFDQDAAMADGTVDIDEDYLLPQNLSDSLGYDSVRIYQGTYLVATDEGSYGAVSFTTSLYGGGGDN